MSRLLQICLAKALAVFIIFGPIVCALGAQPPRWAFIIYLILVVLVICVPSQKVRS